MNSSWKIAAIGECMLELSNPGGRPLERNMSLQFSFGGDTLNTAVYLARLGVECSYVTALGEDPYSAWMLHEWQQEGVDTSTVEIIPGRNPGLYMIQTDAAGERSFHYWRMQAAARELFADEARAERVLQRMKQADLVYLSGITLSLYDDASLQRLVSGLEEYRAAGGRVAFDGNYRPRGWSSAQQAREKFQRVLSLASLVLPTFDDEAGLYGDREPPETAQRLHDLGVSEVAVKHGAAGVLVSCNGEQQWVETTPVEQVVDSTAAGDSFNGAYLAARARGLDAATAAGWGNRLAGCVITHPGAIIPSGKMPQLETRT